jgi:hypothetical protein
MKQEQNYFKDTIVYYHVTAEKLLVGHYYVLSRYSGKDIGQTLLCIVTVQLQNHWTDNTMTCHSTA